MKEIQLTQGLMALVDDEDYPLLARHSWHVFWSGDRPYAVTTFRGTELPMTGLIFPPQRTGPRPLLDHVNGNSLDNRKENLRHADRAENVHNARAMEGTSKYKGVSWHSRLRKWSVGIWLEGRRRHLGYYEDEKLAAIAYDEAACTNWGERAWLNLRHFPELWV